MPVTLRLALSRGVHNATNSVSADPTIDSRMQEFHDRIEAFKKAQSPDELVQMIYDFLDDVGWDEEARQREYRLNNIVDSTHDLVQLHMLLAAYKGREGSDGVHWKQKVRACLNSTYRWRRRVALDDGAIFQGFLSELDESFFTYTRGNLEQDCPSFVPEAFDAFTAPEKAEYQDLLNFLRKASAVKTPSDVTQLRSALWWTA